MFLCLRAHVCVRVRDFIYEFAYTIIDHVHTHSIRHMYKCMHLCACVRTFISVYVMTAACTCKYTPRVYV